MAFCLRCGGAMQSLVPQDDNRERKTCLACGYVHYENPRNVVGCLLTWHGQVLLCRRAIEPRKNYWTLPAGYLENGESLAQGAARECLEEAHATALDMHMYGVYSLARINQVYVMFRGTLQAGYCEAGEETLEVQLCAESDIPWNELAFPVVADILQHYFSDRISGSYPVRNSDITGRPGAIQISLQSD